MKPNTTQTTASTRGRLRLTACPSCRRQVVFDHCTLEGPDGPEPDYDRLTFAQLLHVNNCTG